MTALVAWPVRSAVGRVIPKTKITEAGRPTPAVRKLLTSQVTSIGWEYKLSPETTGLPATDQVPEIQVICAYAKGLDVDPALLALVGRAVKTPIIFEVEAARASGGRVTRVAASVNPGGTQGAAASGYVTTDWFDADSERGPLPPAVDLGGLYAALVRAIMPVATTIDEPAADSLARTREIERTQRQITRLSAKMRAEKQFNREVELLHQIRALESKLEDLRAAAPPATKDAPWRN